MAIAVNAANVTHMPGIKEECIDPAPRLVHGLNCVTFLPEKIHNAGGPAKVSSAEGKEGWSLMDCFLNKRNPIPVALIQKFLLKIISVTAEFALIQEFHQLRQ